MSRELSKWPKDQLNMLINVKYMDLPTNRGQRPNLQRLGLSHVFLIKNFLGFFISLFNKKKLDHES